MLVYQILVLVLLILLFGFTKRNLSDFKKPRLKTAFKKKKLPLVSILIPARNEAKNIGRLVKSVAKQTYKNIEILVLDDHSEDKTAKIVRQLAKKDKRIKCFAGKPLPKGWSGKNYASQQLGELAKGEWLLFCDADTRFSPKCVESVLHEALSNELDALSLFPHQQTGSLGEKMVIPLIFFILTSYLPIREVKRNPKPSFSAGCGQFFLIRRKTFREVWGFQRIKKTLHDGPKLAALLKKKKKKIDIYDGQNLVSCRMYRGFQSLWDGLSRSFYNGLNSNTLLVLNLIWHFFLFVAPLFFLICGLLLDKPALTWILLPGAQLLIAGALRFMQNARFTLPLWPAFFTSFSMALFCAIQVHSFLRHKIFHSVTWKNRPIPS